MLRLWASLVILFTFQHGTMASVYWTANVAVEYRRLSDNQTVHWSCECGVYGYNSEIGYASASVKVPIPDPLACYSDTTFTDYLGDQSQRRFIALIKRGNCSFSEKVRRAVWNEALAVAVYNLDGTGNETSPMYLEGTENTVAIMIGNSLGLEIVKLIRSGVKVEMAITVGNPHGPWMSQYSLILVSLSFFVVTAVTVGYFIFHSARRLYRARAHSRRQKQLKDEAKKAIGQLQVRTLLQGDQETGPEADTCAVCIESYKPGDVVSIMTCSHFFHKTCIEPWLLEHRTCPMCKCDILKSLGIEPVAEEPDAHGNELQLPVPPDSLTQLPALSVTEMDTRSDVASSGYASVYDCEGVPSGAQTPSYNVTNQSWQNPSREGIQMEGPPHYDNLAFVGDTQSPLEAKS